MNRPGGQAQGGFFGLCTQQYQSGCLSGLELAYGCAHRAMEFCASSWLFVKKVV
jgi:hypothetical protein